MLCLQMLFSDEAIEAKRFWFGFDRLKLITFFCVCVWNSFKMFGHFFNGSVSW